MSSSVMKKFEVTEHGGIDPESESPRFVAKHLSAYELARTISRGSILEIGFGDGYGAHWMAETCRQVTAIDLFEKNVLQAAAKYRRPNLKFLQMEATQLTLPERSFDLVLSFQVIEHIPQAQLPEYVRQIKRVLKADGKACLSTLNLKKNQKPGKTYDKSPHHDKEFTPGEFRAFLKKYFKTVRLYGLYPTFKHYFFEKLKKSGLTRGLPEKIDPVAHFYKGITPRDFVWKMRSNVDDCIDMTAVCHD